MFSPFTFFASQTLSDELTTPKIITPPPPPPTPINFPRCIPSKPRQPIPKQALVTYLQTIHRPIDLRLDHLELLNPRVLYNVSSESLLPDASFLPPREAWSSIPASELSVLNGETRKSLSNGAQSPGAQTFVERLRELSIANDAAFRTVRRVPASPGQPLIRLGNAFEFFKNLELLANYWDDTSLDPTELESPDIDSDSKIESQNVVGSSTRKGQTRTGSGSSMPNDVRQNLLTSFVKLVSYDFGCNVTIPRLEPRLHLKSHGPKPMHTYFPSTPIFVYRTPNSRPDARAGIVEGPIMALSPRAMTDFGRSRSTEVLPQPTPSSPTREEIADLSREIINLLTTAQLRSRENQTEVRYGDGKWWTTKPRWGGGIGGPIGREIRELKAPSKKVKEKGNGATVIASTGLVAATDPTTSSSTEITSLSLAESTKISSSSGNRPERKKQRIKKKGGHMEIYDAYRMVRPPATNWDRKTRYLAIGKESGAPFDDIFLISCLFHHVSIVRARVSMELLEALDGTCEANRDEKLEDELVIWRSKWFDLFRVEERVEAMGLIWGVMGWLLRGKEVEGKEGGENEEEEEEEEEEIKKEEKNGKMDVEA